ncbi:MAG TPA: hypothetical protein VGX27_03905, partial [Candidatus Dormibacteraeota bacterium]|nr:hypothetical protein [Candidatus Dormibacteraeota bacterium]
LARAHNAHGVDMTTTGLLTFEAGRTASFFASFESPEDQDLTVLARDVVHRLERPVTPAVDPVDQYRSMVESFANSALQGKAAEIPLSESIANMRTLDRVREASASAR